MKKIIISQRYEKIGKFNELRDNIDSRLPQLIQKLGYTPILVSNNLCEFNFFILSCKIKKFLVFLFI